MKQDESNLQRMFSPPPPPPQKMSPEYLELRLALCAGEKGLEPRHRSVEKTLLLTTQDSPLPPSKQQRTHSCKYPSGSRRVIQAQRRARNGSPGGGGCPSSSSGAVEKDERGGGGGGGGGGSPQSLSAPQSRSSSWKKMRRPRDVRHFREVYGGGIDPGERGGGAGGGSESLEDTIVSKLHELKLLQDDDCCVVRSFSTSRRGIINRGDSFKRKSDVLVSLPVPADAAVAASGDVILLPVRRRSLSFHARNPEDDYDDDNALTNDVTGRSITPPPPPLLPSPLPLPPPLDTSSGGAAAPYTVLVMGDHGVGKTALLQQFMTSEFMAAIETTFDMECEKTVSVLLDGQETILNFVDLPISVQKECIQYAEIEAYLVTYSITERESFNYAANILQELRRQGRTDAAIILVANKNDLVRSRQVTEEEAKFLCERMSCKFIEVSAALNHRVDDLLVGLVQQIRLNPRRLAVHQNSESGHGSSEENQHKQHSGGCLNAALNFIIELIRNRRSTSRSCENLWVL